MRLPPLGSLKRPVSGDHQPHERREPVLEEACLLFEESLEEPVVEQQPVVKDQSAEPQRPVPAPGL